MTRLTITRLGAVLLLCTLLAADAQAQALTEIEREAASLRGVTFFYTVVEVEAGAAILRGGLLQVEALNAEVKRRLREGEFMVLSEARVAPEDRHPVLLIHVNVLDADEGVYPFATSLSFYQEVHLARDRSHRTLAATWQEDVVGITYHNGAGVIQESVMMLLDTFMGDFRSAN